MTKARKGNELPRAMTALVVIYWGKPVPSYVDIVLGPIMQALIECQAFGRIERVNRTMGQKKRLCSYEFDRIVVWLQLPSTKDTLLKAGRPDLAEAWICALKRFQEGARFSSAFAGRGRTYGWGFTATRRRAIHAKYLRQRDSNLSLDKALGIVSDCCRLDEREIRRAMRQVPDCVIDDRFFVGNGL